ncbi:hypothetical protein AB0D30_36805 [Streptomyces sp. NPDC048409]|uniref:hypothetical protein n=1 Tax=Streptomyces sp. NPDC048409 TaxID=3154723 RepID=UPI00342D61D6
MRTFAPGAGVPEDPACGSMNAGVGQAALRSPRGRGQLGDHVVSSVFMMTKLLTVPTPGRAASSLAWKSS